MPSLPKHLKLPSTLERWATLASHQLNFYRVHMLAFTFVPLFMSGIMYAGNTSTHIPYIDCLFLCMSAMCVCGLSTTNLSTLTTFQQFLLYTQTLIGSLIFVSIVMVYVRMQFFRAKFRHVIEDARKRKGRSTSFNLPRALTKASSQPINALRRRFTRNPTAGGGGGGDEEQETHQERMSTPATDTAAQAAPRKRRGPIKVSKDMIKRVDGGGLGMVNPMGWYDAASPGHSKPASARERTPSPEHDDDDHDHDAHTNGRPTNGFPLQHMAAYREDDDDEKDNDGPPRGLALHHATTLRPDSPPSEQSTEAVTSTDSKKVSDTDDRPPSLYKGGDDLRAVTTSESGPTHARAPVSTTAGARTPYSGTAVEEDAFPRSRTIAFDDPMDGMEHNLYLGSNGQPMFFPRNQTTRSEGDRLSRVTSNASLSMPRTYTLRNSPSYRPDPKLSGYGGFPTPARLVSDLFHRVFPSASDKLTQTMTMPRTNTITGHSSQGQGEDGTSVPYISFSATVGRNSNFKDLTEEQMDELGGVEYRALKLLFWIVLSYWIILPLLGVCIIAPYIAADNRYAYVFDAQPKHVHITWFAFFQSASGFTNLGMSLADQSVVPFQHAYLMNAVVALLILFGNTCYPILLRFIIWVTTKWVPKTSATHETLTFLLDHPRRCFVYLFPSTTTWFLVCVVIILTTIDFVSFMILDIGTPAIEAIPVGTRIAAGLFQSVAVRAAGFAIVPMNAVAPAVKVMFVIMMYISVYPIAMSVRSTNVYEERSLGLFEEPDGEDEDEEEMTGKRGATAVAKYLGWHARRQLAFDMWWIAASLWLVCIIERPHLNDPSKYEYMNIFNIIFELVSAYGTVGLSLGVPYDNFSLVGDMRTLSKLVICVVMLRGRHRGLPVAIDRAVMLPRDFTASDEAAFEDRLRRSRSRQNTSIDTGFPRMYTNTTAMTDMYDDTGSDRARARGPMPIPKRRDSSPTAVMRKSSFSASSQDATPITPSTLTFALKSAASERDAPTSYAGGSPARPAGTGFLTPVHEQSRRPTLTEEPEELSAFRQRSQAAPAPGSPLSTRSKLSTRTD